RLAPIARRILARADRIDPARALSRLLIEPIEELPHVLDPLYRAGVALLLADTDVGGVLLAQDWERLGSIGQKAVGKLAKQQAKRTPPARAPAVATPSPRLADVRVRYGVDFPEEMLAVWELASSLSPKDPRGAFADDDLLGVTLVGPFDVLAGK